MSKLVSKSLLHGFLIYLTLSLLSACSSETSEEQPSITPDKLLIGVPPGQNRAALEAQYGPLFEYLSTVLNMPYEVVPSTSYKEQIQQFADNKINLGLFGGYGYVEAHIEANAEALVMRDIDTRFTSYFLVRANQKAKTIQELKGKSFAFGSMLSTSGYMMPRHFMNKQGIDPEHYFNKVIFTGAHDKTALMIQSGEIDAGVANANIIKQMYKDGRLKRDKVRILWETPPYHDYVWIIPGHFNKELKRKIRDAFLGLVLQNKEHRKILSSVGASTYLPAYHQDFEDLDRIVKMLESEGNLTPESSHQYTRHSSSE